MFPTIKNPPLCADCGQEIPLDHWQPPETSLCPACEKKIGGNKVAWIEQRGPEDGTTKQVSCQQKAA